MNRRERQIADALLKASTFVDITPQKTRPVNEYELKTIPGLKEICQNAEMPTGEIVNGKFAMMKVHGIVQGLKISVSQKMADRLSELGVSMQIHGLTKKKVVVPHITESKITRDV